VTQPVSKASDVVSLGSSANVTARGQAVTFAATITPTAPGAGTPTRTVSFYDGWKLLGTGTINASSGATFQSSSLAVGVHSITASYCGDGDFNASTGGPVAQYVNTSLTSFPKLSSGAYNLAGANLSGAYLVGVNLAGASLSGSNLKGAVFLLATLTGANLTGANLHSANLTVATLAGAKLAARTCRGSPGAAPPVLTALPVTPTAGPA
jgi:hypothetical protein